MKTIKFPNTARDFTSLFYEFVCERVYWHFISATYSSKHLEKFIWDSVIYLWKYFMSSVLIYYQLLKTICLFWWKLFLPAWLLVRRLVCKITRSITHMKSTKCSCLFIFHLPFSLFCTYIEIYFIFNSFSVL